MRDDELNTTTIDRTRGGRLANLLHEFSSPSATSIRDDFADKSFRRAIVVGLIAYVVTRLCLVAGAGVRAAQRVVDVRKDIELGILDEIEPSAGSTISNVLTSWDGRWYLEIVRFGYPKSIPVDITYNQLEARAAFFPVYPWLVRVVDFVLPGGDTLAALFTN
ncbi:MAG: hypothetical protein ACI88S_001305, partial [Ilumatobacter sp.]